MFSRVLVANRGEIAVRVLGTLRRLGITGIAVASSDDRGAPHVDAADVVVHLSGETVEQTYLSVAAIVDAARRTGAEAVHPGYGFLSESGALARACADAGIAFVGPPAPAIETMGDKIAAKTTVAAAGVPVVPGIHEPALSDDDLVAAAEAVGYPILVKAAAGGGGKGMRAVHDPGELPAALQSARREARGAFGDDSLLLERLVPAPRHIEIQVLADVHGTVWAFTERDCTLQRRHQKIVEESPSPVIVGEARARLRRAATDVARACGYTGAGTVEFVVPGASAGEPGTPFHFIEMNTRLQVEHPVTELVHDLDLVEWQLRIAAGQRLPPEPPRARGHAVEARVYAEDPRRGFLPTGGTVVAYREPRGVRVDSGVARGSVVGASYDPMVAKVVAHADDRTTALARLTAALGDLLTLGLPTNSAFLQGLLAHDDVRRGEVDTGTVERVLPQVLGADDDLRGAVPVVAAVAWLLDELGSPARRPGWRLLGSAPAQLSQTIGDAAHLVVVDGSPSDARVRIDGGAARAVAARRRDDGRLAVAIDGVERAWDVARAHGRWLIGCRGRTWTVAESPAAQADARPSQALADGSVRAPMPGTVTVLDVTAGAAVVAGQRLMVIEAMKMEHPVTAGYDAVVTAVDVHVGDRVAMNARLAQLVAR